MRPRTLVAAAVAALCLTGSGGVALAATAPAPRDCVLDAVAGTERCFADFRTAVAFATGGAVTDAPMSARAAAGDRTFRDRITALADRRAHNLAVRGAATGTDLTATDSSVIGATLFTGVNYTGDSETIRIPKPCVKDGKYDYGFVLGTVGRNSASVQPWANCWIWLHSGDTWDSPRQGPYTVDTPDLGDWKRRAVLMGLS